MATTKRHDVKDLSLASEGVRRIQWADRQMPVLQTIRDRFEREKPLEGYRISACLHVTTETANLMRTLKAGGADVVLCASSGTEALEAVLAAIDCGKTIALANKEVLVMAGALVTEAASRRGVTILPVDSEHNAIHQCLHGRSLAEIRRLVLTASGGPFRGRTAAELAAVSAADALKHPTWRMGRKITVDSATLMNKGLEAIEAHHLFGIPMDRVEVVVHPQSIVHGIVEFHDGSCILQAANADMRLPIQVALAWPDRLPEGAEPLEWSSLGSLDFEPVDRSTFRCLDIAFEAARKGVTYPAVMNAANEEAVGAFLDERLAFTGIPSIVEDVLAAHKAAPELTLEAVLDAEQWARAEARSRIEACS